MARLHREALEALLGRIASGEYEAGALLPKEQALAAEFDISRGTAREALRALEERGVVAVKHGRGARVLPPEEWNVLDPSVAAALSRRRDFVREVEALRQLLEDSAAALAAERATARQREALRVRAEELAEADDLPRAAARLRRQVAVAAGNRPLAATLRALDRAAAPAGPRDADACARLATAVADGAADEAREAVRALYPAR